MKEKINKIIIFTVVQILAILIVIIGYRSLNVKSDNISKLQAFSSESINYYVKDTLEGFFIGSGDHDTLTFIVVYDGEHKDVLVIDKTAIYSKLTKKVNINEFLTSIKFNDKIYLEYRIINDTRVALSIYY